MRHIPLIVLLVIFGALHALYNATIPLGEGPDEPGHLAYLFFLAEENRLPIQRGTPEASDVPGEGHQAPLAYLLAAPAAAWLPAEELRVSLTPNPTFLWAGGSEPGAFQRGSREYWPWEGATLAWHMARAVSGLWGAATVLFTYLAAREIANGATNKRMALLAAGLVALNPQFLFLTALVTNDALLAALGAALLWICLRGARGSGGALLFTAAGALFGLALITKQSALLLGPLLLWAGWRGAGGNWRRVLVNSLAWGSMAIALSAWWFARNWQLYGDPFGLTIFAAKFTTQPFIWSDPAAWWAAIGQLFASFWGRFGWMSLPAPGWTLWFYGILCGLAVIGWMAGGKGAKGAESGLWAGPLIALGMALAWTVSFALTAGLVAWQGRMLFPAVAAVALLVAGGMHNVICKLLKAEAFDGAVREPACPERSRRVERQARGRRQKAEGRVATVDHEPQTANRRPQTNNRRPTTTDRRPLSIVASGVGATLLALALYMPLGVIGPAYRWEALRPAEALANLGNPAYGRFAQSWEQGVELRGWRAEGPARAGEELAVTLTWQSLEHIPRGWTVLVQLVDAGGNPAAESSAQPVGGTRPFPLWTPGDWVADRHTLNLPAGMAPGEYRLLVALYRPEKNGERQDVWAVDGSPLGNRVELGTLQIAGT